MYVALRVSALAHTYRSINILSISDSYPYVSSLVCAFFMFLTPLWIIVSSKHPASRTLLYSGWEPVITAMVISRCVCVCVYYCFYCSVEKTALGCPQLPLSGMLDDSSPEHVAAPKHMHLQLPLSPAALEYTPHTGIDWLVCCFTLIPQWLHSMKIHSFYFIQGLTQNLWRFTWDYRMQIQLFVLCCSVLKVSLIFDIDICTDKSTFKCKCFQRF